MVDLVGLVGVLVMVFVGVLDIVVVFVVVVDMDG